MSEAGIRFVFFSDLPEASAIAFGHQLGLWSDWNCCISLRDLPTERPSRSLHNSPPGSGISLRSLRNDLLRDSVLAEAQAEDSQQRPRLPHGIAAIRRHIKEADDVPLRVSMFCDATPSTITQMLGILQEHGELVISCGSGLNLHNMPTFAKADLSISVEPLPPSRELLQSRPSGEARGEADLAAELSSVPCALTLGRNWSMAALIDIICVSRMLLDAMRQAYVFVVTAATLHMAVALSGNCLFLPRILDHSQVLVTLLVIVPIHLVAIVRSGCAIATNVKAWNPMRLKLSTKVPPSALRPPPSARARLAHGAEGGGGRAGGEAPDRPAAARHVPRRARATLRLAARRRLRHRARRLAAAQRPWSHC
jgi:magnesium-transporting ATPase (P-type)